VIPFEDSESVSTSKSAANRIKEQKAATFGSPGNQTPLLIYLAARTTKLRSITNT